MLYSGIDLHKRSVVIATVDERGTVVREESLPACRAAVTCYFRQLPEPSIVTVEATSSWYWLHDLLEDGSVPLTLAHAKFVKAIAYAKVKTDAVDALTLAHLHRADLIPRAHMVSSELRPLRDLLRTRLHLVQKRTSAKNSVLSAKGSSEEPSHCPHACSKGARTGGLYRASREGRLQSHVQRPTVVGAKGTAVATQGKPRRLTEAKSASST